jgi:hypothetical protein
VLVEVFDAAGRKVYHAEKFREDYLNLEYLHEGTYILRLYSKNIIHHSRMNIIK